MSFSNNPASNNPPSNYPPQEPSRPLKHAESPGAADPALARQAAWRFSARNKNNSAAWIMWALAPFVVGVQIHDFYLGSIGRGLIKIGLMVLGWGLFMVGYVSWIVSIPTTGYSDEVPPPGPLFLTGIIVSILCFLALLVWWIVDAFRMTRRIEAQNDKTRQQIAGELGIDPWSF